MSKRATGPTALLLDVILHYIMGIFALLKMIASRIVIAVIALFAVLGLSSVSDSPTPQTTPKDVVKILTEEAPLQESIILPEPETAPAKESSIDIKETEISTGVILTETKSIEEDELPSPKNEEETVNPLPDEEEPPLSFSQINTQTAETLVNILCTQNAIDTATPITGSGVIIDPRGIVVTNAHVAQFFLLKDFPTTDGLVCVLRAGSPARTLYTAELLFISPKWVSVHASDIRASEPKGTGEHDFAFLRITGRTDPNAKLPDTFPFVPIDINDKDIKTGDNALLAAYPAGFLGGISIQRDLYSVSSIATVGERFTFFEKTIDLFSIGGTVVSQGGSSGGAVVSDANKLIGIIVTSTQADTTAQRDLRAITLGHINRSLVESSQTSIEGLLLGDVALKAKLFNENVAPTLFNQYLEFLLR